MNICFVKSEQSSINLFSSYPYLQLVEKKSMKRQFTLEIISFLFSLLFLYAAIVKLIDYQKFTVQIDQSPLLTGFGSILPWLVISAEFTVATLMFMPRFRFTAFLGAFSLMTMFTVYIVAILNFSDYIPCSCGGILEKLGWKEHLIFNATFVVLALAGIVLSAERKISFKEDIAS